MTELIQMLEAAEVGSHILDARVWCALTGHEFVMWDGAGCVYRMRAARNISHIEHSDIPPTTKSIDAAVALAERVLPGWNLTIGNHHSVLHDRRGPNAIVSRPLDEWNYDFKTSQWAFAATIPLALCIAILKAHEAQP